MKEQEEVVKQMDISKKELKKMGFRSMNEHNCECDCIKGTCSDCFIRGYVKPWCTNCHNDFNDGKCGCKKPAPYIKKGWIDVTPYIVKHTPAQKKLIYKKIDQHNKFLEDATKTYENMWQGKTCKECGKEFKVKGKCEIDNCKKCTIKSWNSGGYEE